MQTHANSVRMLTFTAHDAHTNRITMAILEAHSIVATHGSLHHSDRPRFFIQLPFAKREQNGLKERKCCSWRVMTNIEPKRRLMKIFRITSTISIRIL